LDRRRESGGEPPLAFWPEIPPARPLGDPQRTEEAPRPHLANAGDDLSEGDHLDGIETPVAGEGARNEVTASDGSQDVATLRALVLGRPAGVVEGHVSASYQQDACNSRSGLGSSRGCR
jgi:hypothetical protein